MALRVYIDVSGTDDVDLSLAWIGGVVSAADGSRDAAKERRSKFPQSVWQRID